jgi:hypothetical protein
LSRRGFRNIGIVVADDLELAERRFFDSWIRKSTDGDTRARTEPAAAGSPALARTPSGPPSSDVLGLFPEPGAPP